MKTTWRATNRQILLRQKWRQVVAYKFPKWRVNALVMGRWSFVQTQAVTVTEIIVMVTSAFVIS